ncbi:MAG: hypothetical protein U5J95_09030 [Balneolaceae bacterium]|nr:hypothetical protein [Balneolaceae bacterium]
MSSTTVRPESTFGELYFLNPQLLSESIGPGVPLSTGEFSTEDNAFHFDITSLVNSSIVSGVDANKRFYITLNSNDGVIRSSLIFNEDAPDIKRPRLIITYIKSEDL